jgi:hypothetical protein
VTETKSFADVVVKSATEGRVSALFSRFNVVDLDGDVTLPGAIPNGVAVVISAYGHGSWERGQGALPVGKGVIRTTATEAVLDGRFFMDTTAGRDTFTTVKELGPLGEWSYSLENVIADRGEWDGQVVRILRSMTVKEVSPVLRGAGIRTATLSAKSARAGFEDLRGIRDQHRIQAGLRTLRERGVI